MLRQSNQPRGNKAARGGTYDQHAAPPIEHKRAAAARDRRRYESRRHARADLTAVRRPRLEWNGPKVGRRPHVGRWRFLYVARPRSRLLARSPRLASLQRLVA